jgi:hypothetical protein
LDKLAGVELALGCLGIPVDVLRDEAKEAISRAANMRSQDDLEILIANIVARVGLPYERDECKEAAQAIWSIVKA